MAVVSGSNRAKGSGGRGGFKLKGVCWNCREKEHFKDKRPKPSKALSKPASSKSKATGSANAATDSDSDNGVFNIEDTSNDGSMPALEVMDHNGTCCMHGLEALYGPSDYMPSLHTFTNSLDYDLDGRGDNESDGGHEDWFSGT